MITRPTGVPLTVFNVRDASACATRLGSVRGWASFVRGMDGRWRIPGFKTPVADETLACVYADLHDLVVTRWKWSVVIRDLARVAIAKWMKP